MELLRWLLVVVIAGALFVFTVATFNRKRVPIGYQPPPPLGDRSR